MEDLKFLTSINGVCNFATVSYFDTLLVFIKDSKEILVKAKRIEFDINHCNEISVSNCEFYINNDTGHFIATRPKNILSKKLAFSEYLKFKGEELKYDKIC